ncbi:cytochrome p450 [Naviculisporaceae sp. PSN 640]
MASTLDKLYSSSTSLPCIILCILALFLLLYTLDTIFLTPPLPPSIPLLGEPPSSRHFSLKTRLSYYTSNLTLQQEAWHNHLKHGRPVIIPTLGLSSELIIPPQWLKWVHSLPDNAANSWEAFVTMDQPYYSLGHAKYLGDSYQGELVKKFDLERMGESIWDEMGFAFRRWIDEEGETDRDGWKELDVEKTVRMIIAQITSRFIVGLPLCRNEQYLRLTCDIADALVVVAATGMALPPIFMPVAGRIASLPVKTKLSKFRKFIQPVYNERVQQLTTSTGTKQQVGDTPPKPYDHLQLILEFAHKNRPEEFASLHEIANRIVVSNFGGIHQSAIHLGVMVLDLLASDSEFNTISALREEFKRVIYSDGGNSDKWTKAKLASLTKTDSLGRETMRLHTFAGRSVFRKVLVDNLQTPDGTVLPKGTMFSLLAKAPHLDSDIYQDPLKFDPFRFSRMREIHGPSSPPVSFVTASTDYLPFGHGKHACPGRFILDFELKMFFCYLLRGYDVEWPEQYGGKRPPNYYLTEACFPPKGARIRIRKREAPAF